MTVDVDPSVFPIGLEIEDHRGGRWIVVGVHAPSRMLGLKRSTWWRRLYWRVRRLLGR